MTVRQAQLVRDSFESVREYGDSFTLLFYGRLFELAPQLRPLFRTELREQSHRLFEKLALVVASLDQFDAIRPELRELGRRHVDYGARPEHYETLRAALLWALGQSLEAEFDRETRAAWNAVLEDISSAMLGDPPAAGLVP